MIFWRLAGGEEEELLALRVLLFDLVAIFFEESKNPCGGLCRWPPKTFGRKMDNEYGGRIDAEFNGNSTRHHLTMLHYHT